MNAQHTPGPWAVDKDAAIGGYRVNATNGRGVVFATQRDEHPAIGQGISHAESLANARLISAAPDLLAALVEMRYLFDLMCGLGFNPAEGRYGSPKANADAAIAKATGEHA